MPLRTGRNRSRARRVMSWTFGAKTIVLVAAVALLFTVLMTPTSNQQVSDGGDIAPAAVANPSIPVDIPTTATPKKVFAHYFPPYPISIDNADPNSDYYATQYLNPNGENNKHAAYGGLLRDRPLPRPPSGAPDWKVQDLRVEVEQAMARGIDGFLVDILVKSSSTNWLAPIPRQLIDIAATTGGKFSIVLMPDMNGELGSLSPDQLAVELSQYAGLPGTYSLSDQRLVVSPFYAERQSASWWSSFLTAMRTRSGKTVAFVPTFLDAPSNITAFAPISYGMSNWGNRNPAGNPTTDVGPYSPVGIANRVHSLGKIWMQPVSFQDSRPNQSIYDEAQGTQNLRNTWDIASASNAEWVQLTTWNDHSEGATFAPSARHGWGPLDISAYYLVRFKYGAAPTIKRVGLYVTHRTQAASARPSFPETRLMTLRNGSSPPQDRVEALVFQNTTAQVTITVGSTKTVCTARTKVSVCTAPLVPGAVSVKVTRLGSTVASVTSPYPVTATPVVQTLDYTVTSSRK